MGKQINDTEYLDYLIGPQICFGGYFSPFLRIYWENIKKSKLYHNHKRSCEISNYSRFT